jgi:cytochrome c556
MRFKILLAGMALSLGALTAAQAADPIAERQAMMKANAAATKTIVQMAQGKAPYDAAAAQAAFELIAADMKVFPTLFPEGSDQGKTTAAPAIWTDKAGFEALAAKLSADAATGAAAAADGLDAIKASAAAVGASCGSCHEKFRVKKS